MTNMELNGLGRARALPSSEQAARSTSRLSGMDPSPQPMNEEIVDAVGTDWLTKLEDRGLRRVYPPRTVIIHEGDVGDTLFIIRSGRGKVYSSSDAGKEVVLGTFGPGDILGEPSLDGGLRSASVMTLEQTTCVIVQSAVVLQMLADDPQLALQIIRNLIRLVRSASESREEPGARGRLRTGRPAADEVGGAGRRPAG